MKILYNKKSLWKKFESGKASIYSAGDESAVSSISNYLKKNPHINLDDFAGELRLTVGHYGFIFGNESMVIAVADPIRSYPILFSDRSSVISCSASALLEANIPQEADPVALREFIMSGYTWGPETVYSNIKQLQAGEFIYFDKSSCNLKVQSYYRYHPAETDTMSSDKDYFEKFDNVLDSVIKRVVKKAGGDPIWVPLSGGLDSRIIICKLHQIGYDKLFAFSYGPLGSREAETAKIVCTELGIPWTFAPPQTRKALRSFFDSDKRREYWNFAENFSSIPTMQDLLPIHSLLQKGIMSPKSIIINGQTGDFISGAHIPKDITSPGFNGQSLYEYILKKHFSIWKPLRTPEIMKDLLDRISGLFPLPSDADSTDPASLAATYEEIEWQCRQSRYVVNGQRVYDHLGLKWQLPLWDLEMTNFWQTVPMKLRLNAKLFKTYLRDVYDYKGLFTRSMPPHRQFPVSFGKFIGGLVATTSPLGLPTEKLCSIFSQYGEYYSMFPLQEYFKSLRISISPPYARGIIALSIRQWLRERNLNSNLSKIICPR